MKSIIAFFVTILSIFFKEDKKDDKTKYFSKQLDYAAVKERREELKDNYGNIKWIPSTVIGTQHVARQEDADYSTEDIALIAENILHYQNPDGGWGKGGNYRKDFDKDELRKVYEGDQKYEWRRATSDFDNNCTWGHIEFLAEVYRVTNDKKFREAIKKAVRFIVESQHENGSWENKNHRHITYNDDLMKGVMTLLHKILHNTDNRYRFLGDLIEELDLQKVYDRGLEIILKTQVVHDGELRIWGQQHDHKTLEPTWARSYEMPAYATSESAGVIDFLKLHLSTNPEDEKVRKSIDAAIAFLRKIRQPDGRWGRFHHLEDLRPIFCDRDGIVTYNYDDLGDERKYGYGWWRDTPARHL